MGFGVGTEHQKTTYGETPFCRRQEKDRWEQQQVSEAHRHLVNKIHLVKPGEVHNFAIKCWFINFTGFNIRVYVGVKRISLFVCLILQLAEKTKDIWDNKDTFEWEKYTYMILSWKSILFYNFEGGEWTFLILSDKSWVFFDFMGRSRLLFHFKSQKWTFHWFLSETVSIEH